VSTFEQRNVHFDRLFATKNLFWLGQNTNHLPMHPRVRQALLDSIESEEFHAYAPPGGFIALIDATCGCQRTRRRRLSPMAPSRPWRPSVTPYASRERIS
jgi:aspartate/methionine/tyrosine aminotransferase